MSKHNSFKRITAVVLAVSMLASIQLPVMAESGNRSLEFHKNNVDFKPSHAIDDKQAEVPADDETVRVSIILDDESTIDAGYDMEDVAEDEAAIAYREALEAKQKKIEALIGDKVLDGKKLDVVWNLTLAANLISANVKYGQIDEIKALSGVKDVVVETQYQPATVGKNELDPDMSTSSEMIGSSVAALEGYTGAGSVVAIIDTGIDSDHQSFNNDAYKHALEEDKYEGDTLTQEDVAKVLEQLNAYANGNLDAAKLHLSDKVPFAYNYVDGDYDITHDNDDEGEHGSHVTGIAAANRYIPDGKGGFLKALDEVKTQGVAPDAQVITMKVFGKGGGAYDSDYMAAIEDAIVLGADSINLSLGSANAGFSNAGTLYQTLMDNLVNNDSGAVVTMSAGNDYSWAANSEMTYGYLYDRDVNFDTVGSPGSFTNSLAVASVDNIGSTGDSFNVGDHTVFYAETSGYNNPPYKTIAGEHDYILLDNIGVDTENGIDYFDAMKDLVEGKIAMCYRGSSNFSAKANAAAAAGAAGVIIVNNQAGVINMDLSDYVGDVPVVSITQADGEYFKSEGTKTTTEDGITYYTGKMTVNEKVSSGIPENVEFYTMSDFSSWGVPGSLELKPEITAPGGNIYSVNGLTPGGKDYENMSGTSMAAPQVAGMAALVAQYIQENGLEESTKVNQRALVQSLLMSTAEPVMQDFGEDTNSKEEESGYYPVLNQGAGLANVGNAVNAETYIMMDETANAGAKDGKVKVELGEDADRTGVYTFSFTVNSISDTDQKYTLDTDIFTQDIIANMYLDTFTVSLDSTTVYTVDGKEVTEITVPAGGSVKVTVKVTVKDEILGDYPNGAYIEGFTTLTAEKDAEGNEGVSHSIPILGFYGSWSEAPMMDPTDINESDDAYGGAEYDPYFNYSALVYYNNGEGYYYIVNPYGYALEENGIPYDRAAINGDDIIAEYDYTQLRNGYNVGIVVTSQGYRLTGISQENAAFYYASADTYMDTTTTTEFGVSASDLGLKEGDAVGFGVISIPEYYFKGKEISGDTIVELMTNGALNGGSLLLSPAMKIDNTSPEVLSAELNENGDLVVTAKDNNYIGYVAVANRSMTSIIYEGLPEQTKEGETVSFTVPAEDMKTIVGQYCTIAVADYAGNLLTGEVKISDEPVDYSGMMFGFTPDLFSVNAWINIDPETVSIFDDTGYSVVEATDINVTAAAYADGYVFQSDDAGMFYVSAIDNLAKAIPVANIGVSFIDMAFSYDDGQLYALDAENNIYTIDYLTGEAELLYQLLPIEEVVGHDVDKDLDTDEDDAQAILEYLTGNVSADDIDLTAADMDEDEEVTTYDAHLLLNYIRMGAKPLVFKGMTIDDEGNFYAVSNSTEDPTEQYLFSWTADDVTDDAVLLTDEDGFVLTQEYDGEIVSLDGGIGVLEWDHDNDALYMAADAYEIYGSWSMIFNCLYVIDLETEMAAYTNDSMSNLAGTFTSLFIVPAEEGIDIPDTADSITGVALSEKALTLYTGKSAEVSAMVSPWNVADTSVTWTSSDESVATVKDGVITAVKVGTATVTATTNAVDAEGNKLTASVEVTVVPVPNTDLNGVIWDADGLVVWAEFNSDDAENWTMVDEAAHKYLAGTMADDGYLYVHDITRTYKVDPKTFAEVEQYATFDYSQGYSLGVWSDAAMLPAECAEVIGFENAKLFSISVAGEYLGFFDPTNPDYVFGLNFYGNFGEYASTIAYMGVSTDVPYTDENGAPATAKKAFDYAVMTESGHLYIISIVADDSGTLLIGDVGDTGLDLSNSYALAFGEQNVANVSMEYDAETDCLFVAIYHEEDPTAMLYTVSIGEYNEETEAYDDLEVIAQHGFGDDVWPAGALYKASTADAAAPAWADNAVVAANTAVKADRFTGKIMSVNADEDVPVSDGDTEEKVSEGSVSAGETVIDTDANVITIPITAEEATNALLTVGYDASSLTFKTVNGHVAYYSYNSDDEGTVVLNFASANDLSKDFAELVFTYDESVEETLQAAITLAVSEVDSPDNIPPETITVEIDMEQPVDVVVDLGGNGTSDAPATAERETELTFTITPNEGYELPETITVTVDGTALDAAQYTYDPATGKVTIKAEAVTGDIKVTAVLIAIVNVSVDLGGKGTSDAPATAPKGEDLTFTITPAEGYKLPANITVTVDGTALDAAKYTYDPATGKVTIKGEAVTGNIAVTAVMVDLTDKNPSTGNSFAGVAATAAVAIAAMGVIIFRKKRD